MNIKHSSLASMVAALLTGSMLIMAGNASGQNVTSCISCFMDSMTTNASLSKSGYAFVNPDPKDGLWHFYLLKDETNFAVSTNIMGGWSAGASGVLQSHTIRSNIFPGGLEITNLLEGSCGATNPNVCGPTWTMSGQLTNIYDWMPRGNWRTISTYSGTETATNGGGEYCNCAGGYWNSDLRAFPWPYNPPGLGYDLYGPSPTTIITTAPGTTTAVATFAAYIEYDDGVCTNTLTTTLSNECTDAMVLIIYAVRRRPANFVIRILPPTPIAFGSLKDEQLAEAATALNAVVEQIILEHIDQWFWLDDLRL